MATFPPSATPQTNNAILAFIKDIPLHSGVQKPAETSLQDGARFWAV
jgi:hypothetical protein